MGIGVIVVRVVFCGVPVADGMFRDTEEADKWARKWEDVGNCERDGPQFVTEWRTEYI